MKNTTLVTLCLALCLSSICFTAATPASAALTEYRIIGSFGQGVESGPGNDAAAYPFPELYGGTFNGSFSFDLADAPISDTRLALQDVAIDIFTSAGERVQTITRYPKENNHFRYDGVYHQRLLFDFGYSTGVANDVVDLRISFGGNIGGPSFFFHDGFLETDGSTASPYDFWDLKIDSATLVQVSGPSVAIPSYPYSAVPISGSVWLLGAGLLCLGMTIRNRKGGIDRS